MADEKDQVPLAAHLTTGQPLISPKVDDVKPARARAGGKGWRDRLNDNPSWEMLTKDLDMQYHQDGFESDEVQGDQGNRVFIFAREVLTTYGFVVQGAGYPSLRVRISEPVR